MKGVIAVALAGPLLLAPLDRLLNGVVPLDRGEIDRRRRAAMERRLADPRGGFGQRRLGDTGGRHRPVAVDMRIDAAGDDDLACGVDHPSGPKRRKTMVHILDLPGCVAVGSTTDEALEATPEAIRAYLCFLKRHGQPTDSEAPFQTAVAEHITGGDKSRFRCKHPGLC